MKYLAAVVALLLGLGAVLLALPFSAAGTAFLLQRLNSLPFLQVEYHSGRLAGALKLHAVTISTGAATVRLDGLVTRIDTACLWRSAFCFEQLGADAIAVDVTPGGEGGAKGPPRPLQIPYSYTVPALQVGSLRVRWPGGSWEQRELSGAVRLADSTLHLEGVEIAAARLSLAAPEAAAEPQPFQPPEVFLPLALRIDGLAVDELALAAGDKLHLIEGLSLRGTWRGEKLAVESLSLAAEGAAVSAHFSLAFAGNWPLAGELDLALAQEIEAAQLRGRQVAGTLSGDLERLAIELLSPGTPDIALRGALRALQPGLPFTAQGELSLPPEASLGESFGLSGVLAEVYLASPLELAGSGELLAPRLTVAAEASAPGYEQLQLRARARWQAPRLLLEELQLRDPASDSELWLSGSAALAERWSLEASARSEGLAIPALGAGRGGRLAGVASLQAEGGGEQWQLRLQQVDLAGTLGGLPAAIEGSAGLASSWRLLPGQLRASINGARLTVDAAAGSEASARLQVDELGRWLPGASGVLALSASGDLRGRSLRVDGELRNFHRGELEIPGASLEASLAEGGEAIWARLQVPGLEAGEYRLDALSLQLAGSPRAHRLSLSGEGDELSGSLEVAGALERGRWRGELQPALLATAAGDWRLPSPVSIAQGGEGEPLSIAAHCWQHPDFVLCLDQLLLAASGRGGLRLEGDIGAFNGFLPDSLEASGALVAEAEAVWSPDQPLQLNGLARSRDLRITRRFGMGETVSMSWDALDLSATRVEGGLSIQGRVERSGRRVLGFDATLPPRRGGELHGELVLDGLQLAAFAPWVTELSTLEGALSGGVSLAGTGAAPVLNGRLQLREGHLAVVGNPTELTALNLDLALDGRGGTVAGSGRLGGGKVELNGKIEAPPNLQLTLDVSGERHQLLLPPASEMLVSEDLRLVLREQSLAVSGEVRVHEGVLRHEQLPEGSVAISRDVVVVDMQGRPLDRGHPFKVQADIWLRLRDRFKVEGDSLKATLGGDLQLRQEPESALQLFGNLNLVGGELFAFRQHLKIKRGTVAFTGPPENPELNIAAERNIQAEGITVGARLQGRLEEPEFSVYSDPVMSQSEAMSYLVRGRGMDAGAGADGTALALSVGADIVNRSGIVAGLNRLPLISNVAFGASGDQDDTAATVSGYIGNRIYLSYGVGLYEPINVLTARLYLQSRLWLEVVSRLENSVDLYYSFDLE